MHKILSVIIPTYNMEEYLSRCLDSLVVINNIDDIEIVIVNDGSKDKSLEIAQSYKNRYPNSVILIDKPNGNYGSTINAALPVISGKYVKVLDADDWFQLGVFEQFVEKLHDIDCDMILTPYTRDYVTGKKEVSTITNIEEATTYDFREFMQKVKFSTGLRMHLVTYRSEIVTKNNYKQTESISYTDNEWIYYPMQLVNNIQYLNLNLYQHFIGRNEQTTAPKVRAKNYWQEIVITTKMLNNDTQVNTPQYKYLHNLLLQRIGMHYADVLGCLNTEINLDYLKKMKAELLNHPLILSEAENFTIGSPFKFHVVKYWNKTNKKYPYHISCWLKIRSILGSIKRKIC